MDIERAAALSLQALTFETEDEPLAPTFQLSPFPGDTVHLKTKKKGTNSINFLMLLTFGDYQKDNLQVVIKLIIMTPHLSVKPTAI